MFQKCRPFPYSLYFVVLAILTMTSCGVAVKNAPRAPFVFDNKINITGAPSKDEKKRLETELSNYWDDSLKAKRVTNFLFFTKIKNPQVFDTANITRSITFMNSYLQSQGYYNANIEDTFKIDTVKKNKPDKVQYRTTISMDIDVNKNLKIDSFAYALSKPELQKLAEASIDESRIKKDVDYSKQLISGELERLVALYRKNGYFKLTRENLYAEVDTIDKSLLELTLDPFEQARKIAEAEQRRKKKPTINVLIMQRPSSDTNSFTKYYVGQVYFYPETSFKEYPDSIMNDKFPIVYNKREYTIKQKLGLIHFSPLVEHTYLREGRVYNEQLFYKTVNAFNQLGAWSQVDVRTVVHNDSLHTIDFHFFLTPAKKYSLATDLEVSRNSGSIVTGNLLGIANVITLRNRNVWRESIQSSTNLRNGIELGSSSLQTFQTSLSQTFSIPKMLVPFTDRSSTNFLFRWASWINPMHKWVIKKKQLDGYKTLVNLNAAYTDRRNFFLLRSFVGSFGYEWQEKNKGFLYRPVNIELYSLDTLQGLRDAFDKNPFLRNAFNTGYVLGQTFSRTQTWSAKRFPNINHYLRFSAEEAGLLFGRIKSLQDDIYQYVKAELEYRISKRFIKTELAGRIFAGVGYNYSNDPRLGQSLPFFKQFVAGGPNSMRAWNLRQLGLGSSLDNDTATRFRDRYGDIQLELNGEYRFPLAAIGGVKINSALFVDMGNIWNLKNPDVNPKSKLTIDRFFRDIAIAAGTGLRFDFNYFLVRVDFAYKVKDPARLSNNGWMSIKDFEWRNKEFEIKADDGTLLKRNNYAFQLGIGLPF